ncbi:hypothetical protein [Candidatus Nitrosocosmicus sp. R]
MVSVLESTYGKEHNYDSHNNLLTFDLMYYNKPLVFGKSYGSWTAEMWKWAYPIPISENPASHEYGINCNNS